MSDRYDRAVGGLLAAGVAACLAVAAFVRPAPLPPEDASRWAARPEALGPAAAALPSYAIDSVAVGPASVPYGGGEVSAPQGERVAIAGWAVDARRHRRADGLAMRIDGGPWREARYGLPRNDVAAALSTPAARDSGFTAEVDTSGLAPGQHALELATVTGGVRTALPARVRLVLTPR